MLYNGGEIGESDDEGGGRIGSNDMYNRRAELVLVLLLNLYSLLESISVGISRPFSCSALYHLLTTYSTNYYLSQIVYDFVL